MWTYDNDELILDNSWSKVQALVPLRPILDDLTITNSKIPYTGSESILMLVSDSDESGYTAGVTKWDVIFI